MPHHRGVAETDGESTHANLSCDYFTDTGGNAAESREGRRGVEAPPCSYSRHFGGRLSSANGHALCQETADSRHRVAALFTGLGVGIIPNRMRTGSHRRLRRRRRSAAGGGDERISCRRKAMRRRRVAGYPGEPGGTSSCDKGKWLSTRGKGGRSGSVFGGRLCESVYPSLAHRAKGTKCGRRGRYIICAGSKVYGNTYTTDDEMIGLARRCLIYATIKVGRNARQPTRRSDEGQRRCRGMDAGGDRRWGVQIHQRQGTTITCAREVTNRSCGHTFHMVSHRTCHTFSSICPGTCWDICERMRGRRPRDGDGTTSQRHQPRPSVTATTSSARSCASGGAPPPLAAPAVPDGRRMQGKGCRGQNGNDDDRRDAASTHVHFTPAPMTALRLRPHASHTRPHRCRNRRIDCAGSDEGSKRWSEQGPHDIVAVDAEGRVCFSKHRGGQRELYRACGGLEGDLLARHGPRQPGHWPGRGREDDPPHLEHRLIPEDSCGDECFGSGGAPWTHSRRVGEADNPGPYDRPQQKEGYMSLQYRSNDQQGFWGGILPGDAHGHDDRRHGEEDHKYSLVAETCNGTAWGTIARYVKQTQADLIMVQEHHLAPWQVPAASSWLRRHGWQSLWTPAEPGEGEGWRAGVCIIARDPVVLLIPQCGGKMVHGARAIAALVEAPGYRRMLAYAAYLHDGEGLSTRNMAIMASIGEHIKGNGPNMPYLVAGDFQVEPHVLAAAGWAEKMHATIVASGCRRGTCRMPNSHSEIDYFIVEQGLARGIMKVGTVEASCIKTHVPVALTFHARLTSARALIIRKPPAITTTRLYGPIPPPPDWEEVRQWAEDLEARARHADYHHLELEFKELFQAWADIAERELEDVTGETAAKRGLRGRDQNIVWRSIVPERNRAPKGTTADVAHWIASVVQQAVNVGGHLPRDLRDLRLVTDHDELADRGEDDEDADGDDDLVHDYMYDTTIIGAMDIAADIYRNVIDPPELVGKVIDDAIEGNDPSPRRPGTC